MPAADTPCRLVCRMDVGSGLCAGCGRTLEEIAAWGRLTPAARLAVMADLEDRMERAGLRVDSGGALPTISGPP